ncbi:MAG: DUF86 domain-containing protein [Gammaproteobacteria bacterium]|nr:DUF86 domain-containing protein [Gammaproteobacteria bacterium]MCY4255094.1 DUF86 domain-containing protein [Gammaproteobacteria bacterium]
MRPDPRALLSDIESAAADISRYIAGMNSHAYSRDDQTQAAVERKFEIIGEALNRLHQISPEIAERIPRWRKAVDFRNLLIHGYAVVESERVWLFAQNKLPELGSIVRMLLSELGPPEE